MNPLVIASTVCELIDPLLVDREPVGDPKLLAHKLPDSFQAVSVAAHHCPPPCTLCPRSVLYLKRSRFNTVLSFCQDSRYSPQGEERLASVAQFSLSRGRATE